MTTNNTLPPNDGNTYIMTENGWVKESEKKPINKQKFYTVKQASAETGCKISSLRTAIKSGFLLASKVPSGTRNGDAIYINEEDLIDWLDNKTLVRDEKTHNEYLAYMRNINDKARAKTRKAMRKKPVQVEKSSEDIPMDITAISIAIQKLIDAEVAKLKEEYEIKLKSEYEKGFNDGKLEAELDHEDAYNRGVKDGKKKGIEEARAILKTL